MSITQRLASFIHATTGAKIPDAVRVEAVRATFNWVGCAVGGSGNEATTNALRAVRRVYGGGGSTIFGHDATTDESNAAFLNCIASSVDAFDDTDAVMMLHPASPISAAAFAVGERSGASGIAFLEAVVVGMEVMYRLCKMLSLPPAKPRRGFYLSGLTGAVGAAAAVSKLLGLSEEKTAWALGIAAVSASGQQDALSSMCCPFVPSNAARNGVLAGFMAAEGFNGSASAIEGPRGFARMFAEEPDLDVVTRELGQRFDQLSITYKPYPCGIVVHAALDACLELTRIPGFKPTEIAEISALVCPETITLMSGQPAPKDGLQAQVSAHHWIAAVLSTGTAGVEHSEAPSLSDPSIARLRALVNLRADVNLARHAAVVTVKMKDGTVHQRETKVARGSAGNPMTDRELEDKFRDYAGRIIGRVQADDLIRLCWRMPDLRDLSGIARLAKPLPRAAA